MQLGFIGLGRMGGNMVTRLARGGHSVVGYDPSPAARQTVTTAGARGVDSIKALVEALTPPRAVWVMVPAGEATDSVLRELAGRLEPGDLIVDGGNAHYKDDVRRARELAERSLGYVDAGVSGGIWGLEQGYCIMAGGEAAAIQRLAPALATLAPANGWLHVGPVGSGHYVKMIHNGIEYGMMQAYAEGFELMSASEYGLDLPAIAQLWNQGSVVRSWLLELTAGVLQDEGSLRTVAAQVADSGEGRWTAQEAIDLGIPIPVINAALMTRFASQGAGDFAARLLARLRNAFGGHTLPPPN